jgi:hypothetical protein
MRRKRTWDNESRLTLANEQKGFVKLLGFLKTYLIIFHEEVGS